MIQMAFPKPKIEWNIYALKGCQIYPHLKDPECFHQRSCITKE